MSSKLIAYLNQDTVPSNLSEAIGLLVDSIRTNSDAYYWVQTTPEQNFLYYTHKGMGEWLLENWSLKDPESRLAIHFRDIGITHAPDMATLILHCLWRAIHIKPWNLPQAIRHIQEFWRKQGIESGIP
jgi:hypothetical protein